MPRLAGSTNKARPTRCFLYIPAMFDTHRFPELQGCEDSANWLIHKIITSGHRRKHDPFYDGMAHISRETMRQFINPEKVSHVRQTLIDKNVIVCDESYRHGADAAQSYSQRYGLHPDYAGDLRRVEVRSNVLAKKIKAHRVTVGNRAVEADELDATLKHLNYWLRQTHIDINAVRQIVTQFDDKPRIIRTKVGKQGRRRFVKTAIPSNQTIALMSAEAIANAEFEFSTCPYGRVHTNATRLATELRPTLTINGHPLASTDIRNSQLVFLSLLLIETFGSADPSAGTPSLSAGSADPSAGPRPVSVPSCSPHPSTASPSRPRTSYTLRSMFYSGEGSPEGSPRTGEYEGQRMGELPLDVQEFVGQVMAGTIYDELMNATGYGSEQRRQFKAKFFEAVLYGDTTAHYSRTSPITKVFKEKFPNVWQFVVKAKQNDYRELAREMQRRESRFMIGRVCGRLAGHHAHIPILTIHDSVLAPPEHMPTVTRIIKEEFDRIGVSPALH